MVGPLSVIVDPVRAEQVFGLAPGQPLPAELASLYHRQLEEAQILVLALTENLDASRADQLRRKLAAEFSAARIIALDAPDNGGLAEWINLLDGKAVELPATIHLDAEADAEAVAVVGCLQAVVEFTLSRPAASPALLESIGRHLRQALEGVPVLHLHVALRADETQFATLHLIGDGVPRTARTFDAKLEFGELMINLRAATHPEQLHTAVRAAIVGMAGEFPGLITEFAHLHYFRPIRPEPVHRLSATPA
jgi:G3E family GTPase